MKLLGKSIKFLLFHSIPIVALGLFAYWAMGFLLRDDLFIFGDNPGQFFRLWYPLRDGFSGLWNAVAWNPSWYAGYPELQFYPPGFVYMGIAINLFSLGRITPFLTFEVVRFSSYLLPALGAYLLFSWLRVGRLTAFAAGLFALIFPDIYGGITGILIGMLGDRLALGLYPIALLAGIWGFEKRRPFALALTLGAVLAAIILLHPFQALAPLITLAVYAAIRRARFFRSLVQLALAVLLAAGLVAFWIVPLLVHTDFATPVLRSSLDDLQFWLTAGRLSMFAVFAVIALATAFQRDAVSRAAILSIGVTPLILFLLIVFGYTVLIQRLSFYALDPIRFTETIFLCTSMLAGVGTIDLVKMLLVRSVIPSEYALNLFAPEPELKKPLTFWLSLGVRQPAILLAVAAIAVVGYVIFQPLVAWREGVEPKPAAEPQFLSSASERYGFVKLWDAIRAQPPGRLLVVSSQLRLRRFGEPLPTYLFTLLPYFTGRETIGGTFHHWSPVATYYWYGQTKVPVMKERTDLMDNQSLFGMKWVSMDEDALYNAAKHFNVSTIVATEYDGLARAFLDNSKRFGATYNDGTVVLYHVNDYAPTMLDFDPNSVDAELLENNSEEIAVNVRHSAEGATLGIKVAYYPLWTAQANGRQLEIAADQYGLMRLRLPAGSDYTITIRYTPGLAEQLGSLVSWVSLLFFTALLFMLVTRPLSSGHFPPQRPQKIL